MHTILFSCYRCQGKPWKATSPRLLTSNSYYNRGNIIDATPGQCPKCQAQNNGHILEFAPELEIFSFQTPTYGGKYISNRYTVEDVENLSKDKVMNVLENEGFRIWKISSSRIWIKHNTDNRQVIIKVMVTSS